jgi:drug/metabolite transporter (DMT)-like permease
MFAIPAIFD